MMKPEQAQWSTLNRVTGHSILWCRHEDKLSPDIPDLSFTTPFGSGWIELKTLAYWPRKHNTTINIPHLRPGQVNFALRRWVMGANCWMLLQVVETNEWLLIDPHLMHKILHRRVDRVGVMKECRAYWEKCPAPEILQVKMCNRREEDDFLYLWKNQE